MGRRSATTPEVQRLAAIYRDHLRRVRWVLRARGIAAVEIDDVVHDVFLAIHRRLPAREPGVELATWICGVARSVAFAHHRGNDRRRATIAAVSEPDAAPLPDEALARHEAWQCLADALDGLRDDQREAFVLVDVMGMRAAEAAALIDAPVNTVYSRLRLARRHCEAVLDLPAAVDRAQWLEAAARGELPGEARRRRAWSAIVAALPVRAAAVGSGVAGWVVAGVLAAGASVAAVRFVGGGGEPVVHARESVTKVDVPAVLREPKVATAEPAAPTVVTAPAPAAVPAAVRVGRARSVVTPPVPAEARDELAAAVEMLRGAQAQLARGDAAGVLATIDAHRDEMAEGPLARDVLRLERTAACRVADRVRADRAYAELVRRGYAEAGESGCAEGI
jgi:RNA polymerase sigma-70 factor, ECF subfamily